MIALNPFPLSLIIQKKKHKKKKGEKLREKNKRKKNRNFFSLSLSPKNGRDKKKQGKRRGEIITGFYVLYMETQNIKF